MAPVAKEAITRLVTVGVFEESSLITKRLSGIEVGGIHPGTGAERLE